MTTKIRLVYRLGLRPACWLLGLASVGVNAQEAVATPPTIDPTTVSIPDIASSDPSVLSNGYKFFIFHNAAISLSEAVADFTECRSFLPSGTGRALPSFVPWSEAQAPANRPQINSPYGLLGYAIASMILPKLERGANNTILRRCMETRGYIRFAVTEAVWAELNSGDEALLVARQARLATGPRPPQPEVVDQ